MLDTIDRFVFELISDGNFKHKQFYMDIQNVLKSDLFPYTVATEIRYNFFRPSGIYFVEDKEFNKFELLLTKFSQSFARNMTQETITINGYITPHAKIEGRFFLNICFEINGNRLVFTTDSMNIEPGQQNYLPVNLAEYPDE
jgi:hypothetical protein